MSFSPSIWRGVAKSFAAPRNVVALGIAAVCLALVFRQLGDLDLAEVRHSLRDVRPDQWLGAMVASALSFVAVGQYDALFHRWLGTGVTRRRAILSGASAIALAQTLGMGLATGTLARWRSLPELSASQAFKLTNYVSLSFMIALGLLTAILSVFTPLAGPAGSVGFAAAAVLITLAVMSASMAQPAWLPFQLPPWRLMLRVTVLTGIDLGFAGLALWILMPGDLLAAFPMFLAAFVLALGAGLLSGAPGGVGPFELCLITLLGTAPEPDLIAAILAFRLVYYALPACLAVVALASPALPEPKATAPHPDNTPPVRCAETQGLLGQPGHRLLQVNHGTLHVAEGAQTLVAIGDRASGGAIQFDDLAGLARDAAATDLWPAFYKISAASASIARRAGWRVLATSQEAWLDPAEFSTESPARRQLRRKLKKAEKAGIEVTQPACLPFVEMARVATSWAARSGGERGFSMGRFSAEYVDTQRCFLAYANDRLAAFATFHANGEGWVLDLMRSTDDAPDGAMHAIIVAALTAAEQEGVPRLSLAAMPLACPPALIRRFWPGSEGLARFKNSFAPRTCTRYLAAPNTLCLLLAGLDILLRIRFPAQAGPETPTTHLVAAMQRLQDSFAGMGVADGPVPAHLCLNSKQPSDKETRP